VIITEGAMRGYNWGLREENPKGGMGISHMLEEIACRKAYPFPEAYISWELLEGCGDIFQFISIYSVPGTVLCTQKASKQCLPN